MVGKEGGNIDPEHKLEVLEWLFAERIPLFRVYNHLNEKVENDAYKLYRADEEIDSFMVYPVFVHWVVLLKLYVSDEEASQKEVSVHSYGQNDVEDLDLLLVLIDH